jgi:pimeloyl-ACP methyl ester carboxylesterase
MDIAKSEGIEWFEDVAVVQNQGVLDHARVLQKSAADKMFLHELRGDLSFDVDKLPQPFPAPTLFIMGRQAHWVGYRDAWGILENYPRATFAVFDRAGHLVWGEQTGLCSALVQEWLDRVEEWSTQTRS